MRQRLRSHLTYANTISTLSLFLVLGGGAYAATGGKFILGQQNSAGAPTKLSSPTTNSNGALKVSNTSLTDTGRGVVASGAQGGPGLWATGGDVNKNVGAIHGESSAGNGIEGYSSANPASGVYGQDNGANSYGVAGHSNNGVAVVGDSSAGWAMQALGNATQTRNRNGFVKAMALVNAADTGNEVQGCFNSQLPPGQATSGTCGITFSKSQTGIYTLDVGFRVDDRFVLVSPYIANTEVSAHPDPNSTTATTALTVVTTSAGSPLNTWFYLVVL